MVLSTCCRRLLVITLLGCLVGVNLLFYRYDDESAFYHIQSRPSYKPGHMGEPVEFNRTNKEITSLVQASIEQYGFNEYASALIPVRRTLPDLRHTDCIADHRKLTALPRTSIVIVFYNEPWSVLLRTVHSVLDNTPGHLIDEILMVDDCSYLPNLKTQLEEYFRTTDKVRIIRAAERVGLIRARIIGSKNTTSSVLTFLDAHVECTKGWLEPLLQQVAHNETTIAVPLIDRIDDSDMHLVTNVSLDLLGAFEWDLNFGWWYRSTFPNRSSNASTPFESPAMAGGLFTITRRFFERLGWYDEQFRVYGMENAELSIKCWMCGGRILSVPCSHVAHIRKRAHPFIDDGHQNVTFVNSIRLAEVWMDEYRQIVFDVNGIQGYSEALFGSVSDRKELRVRAHCKPFRYYLQRAYPEMPSPIVQGQFRGEVHSAALGNGTCLTVMETTNSVHMAPCDIRRQREQYWTHNFYRELNSYKRCIEAGSSGTDLRLTVCHRMRGAQSWSYNVRHMQIQSLSNQQCLSIDTTSGDGALKLETCDEQTFFQRWHVALTEYTFW
ncbi:putative polypeptide N-acetylgalactosaminyltransferase 9 [Anopheles nili]|uniref:putative polypeptide N-acetylgalactosaminyltransferase 9 n=1 Tax=Anopheles nili TaxID=185578 RepID=UPI00237C294F|nr:putative polypeptide N-acetylgalactosaminyltransferase 9 [Anopheles nili]